MRKLGTLVLVGIVGLPSTGPVLAQAYDCFDANLCCPSVALGFSSELLNTPVPFEGIIGGESASGELSVPTAAGARGAVRAYTNIVCGFDPPSIVSGFSLSVALDGDARMADATYAGTEIETILSAGGFGVLEIVDPQLNDGQKGVIMPVVLHFKKPVAVAPKGTHSMFEMAIEASLPQGMEPVSARLRFQGGLRGSGEPMPNAVTIDGETRYPCNTLEASLSIRFELDPFTRFIRGNANNDAKIDISDAIWIFHQLFLGGRKTTCQDAADANNDSRIDISDPVFILNHQFYDGRPPPSPYPDCGVDPEGTDDGIACEETQPYCP